MLLKNTETMSFEGSRKGRGNARGNGRGWMMASRAIALAAVLVATVTTASASDGEGPVIPVDPAEVAMLRALLGVPQPAAPSPVVEFGAPSAETPAATPRPQGLETLPTLRDGEVRGQADEVREQLVCADNSARGLSAPFGFAPIAFHLDRL